MSESLTTSCRSCGDELRADTRFCSGCGAPISTGRSESGVHVAEQPEERRSVTVLFADLSGYTSFAERMDPEAVKSIVSETLDRLAAEVRRFGGYVDKFIGDNVMALFGAPVAFGDDPERAVRAALAMQLAMDEINEKIADRSSSRLQLSIGVNSGEVLAGWMGGSYTVMGDVVNVAARLQAIARAGGVVVGQETVRSSASAIVYEELGEIELKGRAEKVLAWEAVSAGRTRRPGPAEDLRLVGRKDELAQLRHMLESSIQSGTTLTFIVIGEPGVGKTRLAREWVSRLTHEPPGPLTVRWGTSLPYGSNSPYWAMGEVLRQECRIGDTDPARVASEKLYQHLETLLTDPDQVDRVGAVLEPLVGGAVSALNAAEDPNSAREATFASLRLVLKGMAQIAPLLLVLDDLHWADTGMIELVEFLTDSLDAPVLILCLARPELLDRLGHNLSAVKDSLLHLGSLQRHEIEELISDSVSGLDHYSDRQTVVDRCGGNPLFAEELIRHLEERPTSATTALPATLQGLLVARLDLLDARERRVLQLASVIGTSFSFDTLRAVVGSDTDLEQVVDRLREKGFLRSAAAGGELAFHHVLVRDAAYLMLPKGERARQHMEVADLLEQLAGDRGQQDVSLLAEHYLRAAVLADEALLPQPDRERARTGAVRLLLVAGDRSGGFSSNEEALAQYEAAVSLTSSSGLLIDLSERIGDAAMRLGDAAKAIDAWGKAQSMLPEDATERMAELDRKLGYAFVRCGERERAIERYERGITRLLPLPATPALVRLYEDASSVYMEAGENMLAIYMAEKALEAAREVGAVAAAGRAHVIFGSILGRTGDRQSARRNLERALELAGEDEAITATVHQAFGRHLRLHEADYEGAHEHFDTALRLAHNLGDVPLQVDLAAELAELAIKSADWHQVDVLAQECDRLRIEGGLTGRRAVPLRLRGWLAWCRNDVELGLDLFHQSYENAFSTGATEAAIVALQDMGMIETHRRAYDKAATRLTEARRLCEGAGLQASLVQVAASHAEVLFLAGKHRAAQEAAEEARALVAASNSPDLLATVTQCTGVVSKDLTLVEQGISMWKRMDRPLEAARALMWLGVLLHEVDPSRAITVLEDSARLFEWLKVEPLVREAQRHASTHPGDV